MCFFFFWVYGCFCFVYANILNLSIKIIFCIYARTCQCRYHWYWYCLFLILYYYMLCIKMRKNDESHVYQIMTILNGRWCQCHLHIHASLKQSGFWPGMVLLIVFGSLALLLRLKCSYIMQVFWPRFLGVDVKISAYWRLKFLRLYSLDHFLMISKGITFF